MDLGIKLEKLQKEVIVEKTTCQVLGTITFTILTILGAFIRFPLPFTPVPITAQTFFVFLAGLCLGKRWAALSQISYLLLGIGGLPVFSRGGGIFYLAGPTGGYLLGFVVCAWIIGQLIELKSKPTFFWVILSIFIGNSLLYFLGIMQLILLTKVSFIKAFYLGILPFLPGDSLKIISASLIFWKFRNRLKEIFL